MSPRKSDPRLRSLLIDTAARLLTTEGPRALSTRRIAQEAGSSTMAVYTHFDGMGGLVHAMVREGFTRLEEHLTSVRPTADPVCDLALLGRAFRHNAAHNAHLYTVMFGGCSLAGFSLSEDDRQHGRYTLRNVTDCVRRCVGSRRFRAAEPELVAHRLWCAVHGLTTLELGSYLIPPYDADRCFEDQLVSLMVGCGDTPEAARASVGASAQRLRSLWEEARAHPC
ncbi:TetR/AcrR family transcriptional regulator [Nocardiopsis sp. NRRL B-16309]|uniref:TetR/AcrR family transcriptional regulator n=1 Tax=Nocardiopsis sp. NRRL B-16309 TaxID=1519494 RepID=UPI0006AEE64A|nr:TetR/AcrR family transcriptional regulator [Nocardiopsis sp. NRRL B-16309]KOX24121.1 TetR family transcriptional regulator [Nocardiopsis sp. NRRL B-16309]